MTVIEFLLLFFFFSFNFFTLIYLDPLNNYLSMSKSQEDSYFKNSSFLEFLEEMYSDEGHLSPTRKKINIYFYEKFFKKYFDK